MNSDSQMYPSYNQAFVYSGDNVLAPEIQRAFKKTAHLIASGMYLDALTHLCKTRAMVALWKGDTKSLAEVSEMMIVAMLSSARTLEEVNSIRSAIGPWAKTAIPSVFLVAREAGLKALQANKAVE